jgi:hypothetical protein
MFPCTTKTERLFQSQKCGQGSGQPGERREGAEAHGQLLFSLEQSQREVEALRRCVHERNELIERQRLEQELQQRQLLCLSENKASDLRNSQSLLDQLESQRQLIIEMKATLNRLTSQGNFRGCDQIGQEGLLGIAFGVFRNFLEPFFWKIFISLRPSIAIFIVLEFFGTICIVLEPFITI